MPTVFFYERKIENPEEFEHALRWVFEFENVLPDRQLAEEVKYQYVKTEKADQFKKDKVGLDKYLQDLEYVNYTEYNCHYEKGGARFTCKNEGRKSFGIGYVTGLEEFEEMVEEDLMSAIEENFKETDVSDIPEHRCVILNS